MTYDDDLELARQVHYGFLPEGHQSERLDVAVSVVPHANIGGDYCSFVPIDTTRAFACICDASGHGIAAALFAARVNTYVLTHALGHEDPCSLAVELNRFLWEKTGDLRMNATFFSLYLDLEAGTFRFAGAGHPPGLHYAATRKVVDQLDSATVMLGFAHPLPVACEVSERPIHAGDRLLLYSDGLIEAMRADGAAFGIERVVAAMQTHSTLDSQAFNDVLLETLAAHTDGAYDDDVLLMSIRTRA